MTRNPLDWAAVLGCVLILVLMAQPAQAQQNRLLAQARVLAEESRLESNPQSLLLDLSLSQAVPYRVRVLHMPPRLVLDLGTVDWAQGAVGSGNPGAGVRNMRTGTLPDGWARLVLDMTGPYLPYLTEQRVDPETGQARIHLALRRVPLDEFEERATSESAFLARYPAGLLHPPSANEAAPRDGPARPVVMLDPGHGGIDPGAERDGIRESDLVLAFARRLREELLRRGQVDVAMTRDADVFVSLDGRIRAARAAQADLFLSLHADALPEGLATGTVVYLLGEDEGDDAAAYLAQRHDRADLLAGVDLARSSDEIARVLMSVTWQDTVPRSRALADALVDGIAATGLRLHRRPVQAGAFSVLRAPDMPSVLIELGFMSSPRDLANLRDPDWAARMADAIADSIDAWLLDDQARNLLRRQ
ncbi:N-acetylmuramoyl-L-alanine amidase [Roseinatronobacter alkalisoli]|uniref:N-acetylmuramoyl-L-alanine amidase n=1 Tax=Roseinatronobacter alkalisoli TaxID=3028235 RepID=A0ABT5T7N6_9RHOB|nr:N-acetylmuramoyl-L-alanine amidase [Roseinatronobacter sp. HJB301]MDD7971144.1 N-acetylmuramoyl-L-alanine amidase [Roseinatronobacter sp. HJB301]